MVPLANIYVAYLAPFRRFSRKCEIANGYFPIDINLRFLYLTAKMKASSEG